MGRANGQAFDRGNVKMIRKTLSGAAFALAACCSAALLSGSAAHAAQFSAEYVFGDSLSDVGNVSLFTHGGEPASPYVGGQFTNGPVWAQDLAGRLGLPALTPSLAGGTDYAFGGATTGSPSTNNSEVPDLEQQVGAYLSSSQNTPSNPNALYTFSIGANDLFAILGGQTGGLTPAQAAGAAAQVVANEAAALAAAGAKNLVLFDVPDLGLTPEITALGPDASLAASRLTLFFDQSVLIDLAPIEAATGLTVYDLNAYALIDDAVAHPGEFGFSNVTAPCWTGGFTGPAPGDKLCSTPDTYLFWDHIHPTAAGHLLVADAALSALGLPVPEPSTWAMLLVGFGGLGFAGYRARGRAAA
jgi:phospholipase/lecithinase/hemolysin